MRLLTRFICIMLYVCGAVLAQDDVGPKAPSVANIEPKAKEVIDAMSAFYKGLQTVTCSFDLDLSMVGEGDSDAVSLDCKVAVERPNKVSIVQGESELGIDLVSDGTNLAIYIPQLKKYTVIGAPADIQETFQYSAVNGITSFTGIIGELMSLDPAASLLGGAAGASYIGLEDLNDLKHHRIRLDRDNSIMDMWIADGDKPYLTQVVPDLSKETAGSPMKISMEVKLSDWSGNVPIAPERFAFAPPGESDKVESFEAMLAGNSEPRPADELVGKPAPAFQLKDIDGKVIDLAAYAGKNIVVLDFWATWCGPCIQAMPILSEVTASFKEKGVVFIAVNQGETAEEVKAFLKDHQLAITVALDEKHLVGEQYKVTGIPQTVLIGKDGSVQAVHIGVSPALKSELTKELTELAEGRTLAKS